MENKLKALPWVLGALIMTSCCHEAGHAWTAWRLGDRRDSIRSRKTVWTFKHISLIFTIIVPAILMLTWGMMMGGAKPVQVQVKPIGPWRMILVAIAGPLGNFFFGTLSLAVVAGLVHADVVIPGVQQFDQTYQIYGSLCLAVGLSFFLGVLNLLPLPGFDGSHIPAAFMPEGMRAVYHSLRIPSFILCAIVFIWLMSFHPDRLQFMTDFLRYTIPSWVEGVRGLIA